MIAPTIIVIATAPTGLSASMTRLGSRRFSSLMRMQRLRHGHRRLRVAMHAAHQKTDLLDRRLAHPHHPRKTPQIDDDQRVAKLQQFVEVLDDDDDGSV